VGEVAEMRGFSTVSPRLHAQILLRKFPLGGRNRN
jgi:hypothetical protein